jgi:hypothetical protein
MQKEQVVQLMLELLQNSLDDQYEDKSVKAAADLPLVGPQAAVTSMRLVSFIADVEAAMAERHNIEITLVSEKALSRKHSPFRSVDALADYTLETTGALVG